MADKIVTLQRPADDEALFDEYTLWARARRRTRSAVTLAVQQGKNWIVDNCKGWNPEKVQDVIHEVFPDANFDKVTEDGTFIRTLCWGDLDSNCNLIADKYLREMIQVYRDDNQRLFVNVLSLREAMSLGRVKVDLHNAICHGRFHIDLDDISTFLICNDEASLRTALTRLKQLINALQHLDKQYEMVANKAKAMMQQIITLDDRIGKLQAEKLALIHEQHDFADKMTAKFTNTLEILGE